MRLITIIAIVPLLASCASLGLYDMSDEWCAAHTLASPARCPDHQERVAVRHSERVAGSELQRND
jgi:hypothetical protein